MLPSLLNDKADTVLGYLKICSSTVHAAAAVGSEDARYLLDGLEEGRRCADALFGAWAGSEKYMQWKIVQWTVQFLLPELVEVTRALPVLPDTLGLRWQLAMAWMALCSTFGVGFAKTVIVPLVAAAAGTQSQGLPGGGTLEVVLGRHALSSHLQDSASDQVPSSSESVKAARERVLPQLVGAVLPAAGVLSTYIASTLGSPAWSTVEHNDHDSYMSYPYKVTVVFDGLLESATLDVAATVLNCGARLAAAVAPSASRSAASAGLLEWVLHAVQQLDQQLPAGNQSAARGAVAGPAFSNNQQQRGPVRTLDQQQALAVQLVQIVHIIYSHDVRLPRLQTNVLVSGIKSRGSHGSHLRCTLNFKVSFTICPFYIRPALRACSAIRACYGSSLLGLAGSHDQGEAGRSDSQSPAIATAAAVPFVPAAAASASSNSVESSQSESSSGGGGFRARFEMFRKKFTSSGQQQQQGSEMKGAAGSVLTPVLHVQGSVGLQYQQAANTSNDQSSKHSALV
ncbi:hypothetical protein CEUSTIGMA_g477.t1 [Chlamydomonas eustigma]|uniref:Uncharacterized protein n=1 Tax=Chlamydomonas eustigma TaxID=1157962 RepID=A0A250WQA1_9CHLO|nr:hypothetical protein CEUSTIGMA_g477.t1 [Chlamydomonas eustigma]|eukprot:GAX73025.1 hypothetical protein CEUSTIGMA_g477.t1 [Chlamydomonas eustigma]